MADLLGGEARAGRGAPANPLPAAVQRACQGDEAVSRDVRAPRREHLSAARTRAPDSFAAADSGGPPDWRADRVDGRTAARRLVSQDAIIPPPLARGGRTPHRF